MTTMLQLVQQVTAELGVSVPSAAATNTRQDIVQIVALMNAGGYELMSATPWRACRASAAKPIRATARTAA